MEENTDVVTNHTVRSYGGSLQCTSVHLPVMSLLQVLVKLGSGTKHFHANHVFRFLCQNLHNQTEEDAEAIELKTEMLLTSHFMFNFFAIKTIINLLFNLMFLMSFMFIYKLDNTTILSGISNFSSKCVEKGTTSGAGSYIKTYC